MAVKVWWGWTDAKGNTARVSAFMFETTGGTFQDVAGLWSSIQTSMAALTNAHVYGGTFSAPPSKLFYGTNAEFPNIEDKAVLTFQDDDEILHRWQIPAPKAAIFLADGETVDPANGLVDAFINDIIAGDGTNLAEVTSQASHGMASFIGGTRVRRRLHRRFNIRTKDPALTGPGE